MNEAATCCRFLAATAFAILAVQSPAASPTRQPQSPAESPLHQPAGANLSSDFGELPLAFEPNVGQTDAPVRFLTRGGGMTTFFTDTETVMVLSRSRQAKRPEGPSRPATASGEVEQAVVRMKLAGAGQPRRAIGLEKLPGISNYFIGNDPAKWRTDVPHFGRVQYESVYPGIDLVWYGNQRQLEYDFVVAPGADPKQIRITYEGVESVGVGLGGDLVLRTALGEVRQQRPRVYQDIGGKQVEVGAQYTIVARNRVSFELARYDRKRELRIDPVVLVYSTYLGGSADDEGYRIAVDGAGSAYVTGQTYSSNFPTQSPFEATLPGTYDAFVTKLTPAGSALVYSTYLGGNSHDLGIGIAVDGAGSAYVTGYSESTDFPTQSAYQATFRGVADAFVTKLTPAGNALVYSTYLGGSDSDLGYGIAVDGAGSAYVTGYTRSTDFPTQSAYQATFQGTADVFVAKLTPAGNALDYSTYLGGNGTEWAEGIAVDAAGSAYVAGVTDSSNFPTQAAYQATFQGATDAFVTKLTPTGSALVYSTYLGGSGSDWCHGIAVDGAGSAYVTGQTASVNFPTQSAYQATLQGVVDAFVTKLTPSGSALVYSTYLGGSGSDWGYGIAVDGAGSAYVTGYTGSTYFPTQSAYQVTNRGSIDAFVTKLTPAGTALAYSTYLGGSGNDWGYGIAVDGAGSAYVTGYTGSTDFPTQSPYQATNRGTNDAFVAKLSSPSSLTIAKTHTGNFTQGQNGATYTVTVSNATGAAPTSGTVTMTETIPTGLTLVSMNGGVTWNCTVLPTCTTSNALAAGMGFPPITVTVNVAPNAPSQVTNQVSVSGGGSATASATDPTNVTNVCTVTVSPTSPGVAGTGGTLTLALTNGSCGWTATPNVSWLTPAAASGNSGTLNVTVAANATGAQRIGTLTIAGQTVTVTQAANNASQFLSLVSLNPFQGTGLNATLTLVYSDTNGWAALKSAEFIVNPRWEPSSRAGGCYIKYAPGTGLFTLIADDGNSIAGTAAPGSASAIANSQCTLNAASSSVTGSGNTLTVVAALTFQPTFTGQRHIWMQAVDYSNVSTNWLVYGVWLPTQTTVHAGPWYRIFDPFSNSYLYTFDLNEYNTLGTRGFVQQGISGLVMDGSTTVGGISNMAWYRVYVNATNSHFWTSDRNEFLTLIQFQQNYVGEGVAAFVMPYINALGQVSPQVTNTIPFYRAAFQGANKHFWTPDADEYFGRNGKHLPAGYFGEGIACYIFPASGAQFSDAVSAPVVVDAEAATAEDNGSPAVVSVVNGASLVPSGVIAPGEALTINGRHLGGRVLWNGVAAEVVSVRDNEIRVVVPKELAGAAEVSLEVEHRGRRTKAVKLSVVRANPAIFGSNRYGRGNAQARNADGTMNGAEHAAARGSVVTLYTTGGGLMDLPVEVHIGGWPAEVLAMRESAVQHGVMEVQVRVPLGVEAAAFQPVVLHVGNLFSQPGVGLAIQ